MPFLDTVVSYLVAFVLGTLIGAERQYRQRAAGLRTDALVALGSATVAELDVVPRGEDRVEIVAKLVSTNVATTDLDALNDHLAEVHGITHATWQARTHD